MLPVVDSVSSVNQSAMIMFVSIRIVVSLGSLCQSPVDSVSAEIELTILMGASVSIGSVVAVMSGNSAPV